MNSPVEFGSPRPSEGEITPKPRWRPLGELVAVGSLGEALISAIPDLGDRQRPETIFKQPLLGSIWKSENAKTLQELQGGGLVTVADVLALSEDELSSFITTEIAREDIKRRLGRYLENLAVTPHARLLKAVFNVTQSPVPPERELELIEAVEEELDGLNERERPVLILYFGLHDGITRTLKQVDQELRGREFKGMSYRHKESALIKLHRSSSLQSYLTLPEDSFLRQPPGIVFKRDTGGWMKPQEVAVETPPEPPVNNLLPSEALSEEELQVLALQSLEKLGLDTQSLNTLKRALARVNVQQTIGGLLSMSAKELLSSKGFGFKTVHQVAEKLQELLQIPSNENTIIKLFDETLAEIRRERNVLL